MHIVRGILSASLILLLASCATTEQKPVSTPFDALEKLSGPAVRNDKDAFMQQLYISRTFLPHKQLKHDPIALSKQSEAPINNAQAKIIGPSYQDSLRSLAAKLWMIEHAEHTLDLTYYIYKYDPTGYALIGALCDAVKRGVDIRIMVDSLGSMSSNHAPMRALETCAEDAGYMRDAYKKETPHKARVQFVIINALTSWSSWSNRRSHDKLIIKDGSFPGKDMVMTGGRNISVDYYGINKDGSRNKDTYLDLEILLRSDGGVETNLGEITVGDVSSVYYTLLFLHKGNRRIHPVSNDGDDSAFGLLDPYANYRQKAQEALAFIKNVPAIKSAFEEMPEYLNSGYRSSEVRLAHELGNLVSTDVVSDVVEIKSRNTNSIEAILANAVQEAEREGDLTGTLRIISPYLFIAQYKNKEGEIFYDGAQRMLEMLEQYPGLSFEIITNSVLTSDNFYTQSVIDMDTAPRLLLTEEMQATWLKNRKDSEFNPEFVNSEEWVRLINHPRIGIYQTGLLDSALIGGTESYGKLHAKTFFDDDFGFVGTSNFDYRSRLYNNEMGFYFVDPELASDLNKVFEELKSISLRWGTPEWLEMRKKLIASGGFKGYTTGTQRGRYKFLKSTGLIWLF
jgi:phosphatidylserine/phosphatidylglycerophosphate/cardiolipin synthase-like enzyme